MIPGGTSALERSVRSSILNQQQVAEKVAAHRLLKNVQIQGSRNSEERGVRASTPQ